MAGKKINLKLSILISLFSVTAIFVYLDAEPDPVLRQPAMTPYFMDIPEYKVLNHVTLPENAVKMLDLDDYTYMNYYGTMGNVNLYIGYYLTSDKGYAAHSPLVCYQSQGWKIIKTSQKGYIDVEPDRIHYEEIITSFGKKRELVLFWYQSGRKSTTNAYLNKLNVGLDRLFNGTGHYGFIRVAIAIDTSYEKAKQTATHFIKSFYPKFLYYYDVTKPQ